MTVTPDQPAPYAPASAIMDLIERHRNRGLPSPIDGDVLARAGIAASLIPRTLYALQVLDLIHEDKKPTNVLEGLRLAPEAEYKAKLAEWLKWAYADALQYIDPAADDETAIRDAFRNYQPIGQQSRMVTLFTGLFRAAGIGAEKPDRPTKKSGAGGASRSRSGAAGVLKSQSGGRSGTLPPTRPSPRTPPPPSYQGLHPAIAGVLASLPDPSTGWIKADRDRFVAAFTAVLDFAIPTVAKVEVRDTDNGDVDDAA